MSVGEGDVRGGCAGGSVDGVELESVDASARDMN